MPGSGFLQLADVVAPPPAPALLSASMALGFLWLGRRLAAALRRDTALFVAAGFVVAAGIVASVVHALAWAGFIPLWLLKAIGWGIAVLGALEVRRGAQAARSRLQEWWAWARTDRPAGMASVVAALIALGLAAAALAPATDADSLDYHLGVPLDWLRHGGALSRGDWMTARLVGVGDMLNLLGLGAGTDGLGAALQLAGLLACVSAILTFARTSRDRVLAALFVLACPVPLFLATTQKPQLLLVAATTLALAIALSRERHDVGDAVLVGALVGFAVASKPSFLLTGAMVGTVFAVRARRQPRAVLLVVSAAIPCAVLVIPQLGRNVAMYGDPLTPLLERFRAHPDPKVLAFADDLRSYGRSVGFIGHARSVLTLLAPPSAGALSTALGAGVLAAPFIRFSNPSARLLALAALGGAALMGAAAQLTGRFFLEPYLWVGAAFVAVAGARWKRWMLGVLTLQGSVVAASALVGAAVLAPGAVSALRRAEVMQRAANAYAEHEWLNATLAPQARVLTFTRSRALVPRPFVVGDRVGTVDELGDVIARERVDTLVLPPLGTLTQAITDRCGIAERAQGEFPAATRNPFNRDVAAYHVTSLRLDRPAACAASLHEDPSR